MEQRSHLTFLPERGDAANIQHGGMRRATMSSCIDTSRSKTSVPPGVATMSTPRQHRRAPVRRAWLEGYSNLHQLTIVAPGASDEVDLPSIDAEFPVRARSTGWRSPASIYSHRCRWEGRRAPSELSSVRQAKPGVSSGCNSRPGKGNEPPHLESSLGLVEVTTWTKRRPSDVRAVTQVKRLSLVIR